VTILHLLQRIIEQLDELNEQQATVSDLTQALTDMQVYAHSQHDSALCNAYALASLAYAHLSVLPHHKNKCISTF
jgi:hypothetical protein